MGEVVRGRPFVKGQSGNPLGRPRTGAALAEYIRHLNGDDGKLLVDKLQAVIFAHGNLRDRIRAIVPNATPAVEEQLYELVMTARPNLQQIIIAIGALMDRGYGKPP